MIKKNQSAAQSYFDINTGLTSKIFDCFLERLLPKKFIFFSSVKAAADSILGDAYRRRDSDSSWSLWGERLQAEEYTKNHLCFFQLFLLVRIGLYG